MPHTSILVRVLACDPLPPRLPPRRPSRQPSASSAPRQTAPSCWSWRGLAWRCRLQGRGRRLLVVASWKLARAWPGSRACQLSSSMAGHACALAVASSAGRLGREMLAPPSPLLPATAGPPAALPPLPPPHLRCLQGQWQLLGPAPVACGSASASRLPLLDRQRPAGSPLPC